jgi:hypothetical protein
MRLLQALLWLPHMVGSAPALQPNVVARAQEPPLVSAAAIRSAVAVASPICSSICAAALTTCSSICAAALTTCSSICAAAVTAAVTSAGAASAGWSVFWYMLVSDARNPAQPGPATSSHSHPT